MKEQDQPGALAEVGGGSTGEYRPRASARKSSGKAGRWRGKGLGTRLLTRRLVGYSSSAILSR